MSLKPPVPGLRRIHNRTHSPARVEVIVPSGDTLDVSEDVATQFDADGRFSDGEGFEPQAEPTPTTEPEQVDDAADDVTCDVCGFEAKTPGGLASHRRKHED